MSGQHPRDATPAKNNAEESASCLARFAASCTAVLSETQTGPNSTNDLNWRLWFEGGKMQTNSVSDYSPNCCCCHRRTTGPPLALKVLLGRYRARKQTSIFECSAHGQNRLRRQTCGCVRGADFHSCSVLLCLYASESWPASKIPITIIYFFALVYCTTIWLGSLSSLLSKYELPAEMHGCICSTYGEISGGVILPVRRGVVQLRSGLRGDGSQLRWKSEISSHWPPDRN